MPGSFLDWDFLRSRAIYAKGTKLYIAQEARTAREVSLPFVIKSASSFPEGTILVSSRCIGKFGPAWQVMIDGSGKVVTEGLFRSWWTRPLRKPSRNVEPQPPESSKDLRELAPCIFVSGYAKKEQGIVYRTDFSLSWTFPRATGWHGEQDIDSYWWVYSVMKRDTPTYIQDITIQSRFLSPSLLIRHEDVVRTLGSPSVWIQSMTVSRDGNWLAIAVQPERADSDEEDWWLLQYRIKHRHPRVRLP